MLTRKLTCLFPPRRTLNCEAIRFVRSGLKRPVILTERRSKFKKNSSDYLRDVEESNVGVGGSLRSYLEEYKKDIDDFSDDEEDLEFDKSANEVFPTIRNLQGELHEKETQKSFQTIKRKYFRPEKLPSMLTYVEKQQILHLHQEDPDYWDAYKLAEGFPASPEIIKKILKAKFVAYTVQQILRHDDRVRKNWEAFEKGELTFDEELQRIYSSYTGRSRFVTDVKEIEKYLPPPPDFASQIPSREFSSIITSSRKYQLEAEKQRKTVEIDEQGRHVYEALPGGAYVIEENDLNSKSSAKHDTLESFRKKIKAHSVKEVDKIIVSCEPLKELEEQQSQSEDEFWKEVPHQIDDNTSTTGVISKDYDPLMVNKISYNYPLRINIPRKLWKKDKLYRVRDCFYDDNGFFMYRVPGLKF